MKEQLAGSCLPQHVVKEVVSWVLSASAGGEETNSLVFLFNPACGSISVRGLWAGSVWLAIMSVRLFQLSSTALLI